ncbi:C-X-C motif chemokine 9 isoform X1 [Balaenoptera ricei]|uniref:C-X-C motif chemokine n=2 Tax=Balaenoptera TaxID=9766 RepID=A0A8B8XJJ5_BALMU|nr:C-X-C motif chemokine 9 [Balaenoptera musculus]XP_059780010.1 C-X-C motif chemokine 9 isoform X1 [Balaenoptera ricei]
MRKSGVPLLLGIIFLTLIGVQGTPTMRNGRCSCINTSQGTIHSKSLKDLKQFAPSPSCEKTEIIATMKNGDQTCLNPDSTDVIELIKEWEKQVNQKKKQKKGKKYKKNKKVPKVKKPLHPPQKKTT